MQLNKQTNLYHDHVIEKFLRYGTTKTMYFKHVQSMYDLLVKCILAALFVKTSLVNYRVINHCLKKEKRKLEKIIAILHKIIGC